LLTRKGKSQESQINVIFGIILRNFLGRYFAVIHHPVDARNSLRTFVSEFSPTTIC
jgi:hypothetical protein